MKAFLLGFGLAAAFLGLVGVEILCVVNTMNTGVGWYLVVGWGAFCLFAGALCWFIFES